MGGDKTLISRGRGDTRMLKDVMFVPTLKYGLISISKLDQNGFRTVFDNKCVFITDKFNNKIMLYGELKDGLYYLKNLKDDEYMDKEFMDDLHITQEWREALKQSQDLRDQEYCYERLSDNRTKDLKNVVQTGDIDDEIDEEIYSKSVRNFINGQKDIKNIGNVKGRLLTNNIANQNDEALSEMRFKLKNKAEEYVVVDELHNQNIEKYCNITKESSYPRDRNDSV
jgi:hypothetical protein